MIEILFRGKRKDNDEWVEGFVIFADNKTFILNNAKVQFIKEYNENRLNFVLIEVIPETVGQYTGLTNSNSKKIFEGDICENIDGTFLVCWDKEKCAFVMRFLEYPYETLYLEEMWEDSEVIGNIHDNPELLGGADMRKEGADNGE